MPFAMHDHTRIYGLGLTMEDARDDALVFQHRMEGIDLNGALISEISDKLRLSLFDFDGEFIALGELDFVVDKHGVLRGVDEIAHV